MFKGIKGRLIKTYLILTLVTMVMVSSGVLFWLRSYYLHNVEEILNTQARVFTGFFEQYIGNRVYLDTIGEELAQNFAREFPVRVQVFNQEGRMVVDSQPAGGKTVSLSKTSHGERVLTVVHPLKSNNEVVGSVRVTSSLVDVNRTILSIAAILGIGIIAALFLTVIVGTRLSRTVVQPVREITGMAREMATGNLELRVPKRFDDEIGDMAETLNKMAHDLGQIDRLRSEFISSISHELRTPYSDQGICSNPN